MDDVDSGWSRLSAPLLKFAHWLNRNDKDGSRRNIAAHYDLGNRFFELFLDETMAYSCGIFTEPAASLAQASRAKFDAACSKLACARAASARDRHRLGRARDSCRPHYGCRVTTTTISREQYDLARERIARAGLEDRVTLLLEDYRDLARRVRRVGVDRDDRGGGPPIPRRLFPTLQRPSEAAGAMLLQSITIRDQFYEQARRSVDFIKRFIFPGCFIPSVKAIIDSVARATDLKLSHLEDIGPHYARTLKLWREAFLARAADVRAQGYPESFLRMWEYYLCYCEGGFEERQLGDVQMLLTKPLSRRAAIATVHAAQT